MEPGQDIWATGEARQFAEILKLKWYQGVLQRPRDEMRKSRGLWVRLLRPVCSLWRAEGVAEDLPLSETSWAANKVT